MVGGQLIQEADLKSATSKQDRFTCVGCRVKFDSGELQRNHFKTEWHLYNLKRRVCKLNPVDIDSFNVIQAAAPEVRRPQQQLKSSVREINTVKGKEENEDLTEDNEDDWEEVDDEELLDEDYDEEEANEMLARVIKSRCCLFCDKESKDITTNVMHMNLMHGFFIPEEQYLIDLEGFMRYLGFKVGAGATCIWCNKQFTSVHGVRLHMLYKDHCKILYDHASAIDEFKEFYDYSTQEHIPMKPLNQLVLPKKRHDRRAEYSRSLVDKKSSRRSGELTPSHYKFMPAYQAKTIKKFDAYRAKILLRTGIANNNTMRGRIRQQNPI